MIKDLWDEKKYAEKASDSLFYFTKCLAVCLFFCCFWFSWFLISLLLFRGYIPWIENTSHQGLKLYLVENMKLKHFYNVAPGERVKLEEKQRIMCITANGKVVTVMDRGPDKNSMPVIIPDESEWSGD